MTYLITGCAGFIGSHLAERLVRKGEKVIGIDSFTPNYSRSIKEENLKWLKTQPNFTFYESDLLTFNLNSIAPLLNGSITIFHLAAYPSVRAGWGEDFETFARNNIFATQRLLDWAKDKDIKKFIFASTSSIYGDTQKLPMIEEDPLNPVSPYGLTKLAAEKLCLIYHKYFNLPIVVLRYFTVYGPRQRPDMAFHKFIKAIIEEKELEVYGDGTQTRDFTYIDDIIDATIASENAPDGKIFNIGGGERRVLNEVIHLLEDIIGKKAKIKYTQPQRGDVKDTLADYTKAKEVLGYNPRTPIEEGLRNQIQWQRSTYDSL